MGSTKNYQHLKADPTSDAMYGKELSPRERQVMQRMVSGDRVGDAARNLGVATNTVATHRTRAQKKLGGRTKQHAITIFLKRELGIKRFPWEKP